MADLSGKNLILREMNQKELHALWRKYEPENGKSYVYDEEKVELLYQKSLEKADWNPMLGIFLRNNEVIGQVTFARVVFSEARCELNIFLATEAHRNKGYGTEAISLAKSYARHKLGMKKIYAEVSKNNIRTQIVLSKCGFLHTKTYKADMPDGSDRLTFVCIL